MSNNMLTVKELRDRLAGYGDEVIVAVDCENGCDPHPLSDGPYALVGPTNKVVHKDRAGEGEDREEVTVVTLFSMDRIDLSTPWEDEDEE